MWKLVTFLLQQTVQRLLQVEQRVWRFVGERQWSEARQLVAAAMSEVEKHRSSLDRFAPVVVRTPLADGRLLQQLQDAAKQRLGEPVVLSSLEKQALVFCCDEQQCELHGRLLAFELALASERGDYLVLCAALLDESAAVPGYLERAATVAARVGVQRVKDVKEVKTVA
jgi:hypothetical protein